MRSEKNAFNLLGMNHLMTFQKVVSQGVEVEAMLMGLSSECVSKKRKQTFVI